MRWATPVLPTTPASTCVAHPTDLGPGVVLGENDRYLLRRLLGTGGMASVWLAQDAQLGRTVAVKVLADNLALDPHCVARFRLEAQVVASLRHPGVVCVLGRGMQQSRPYLVMEYVPNGTLADRLRSRSIRRDWDPLSLTRQLLDVLDYLHGESVLHRDLKPANVLFSADGSIKLTDFGIAKRSSMPGLTGTDEVMGTERYVAPEVRRGAPADARSDLYSCGVVLDQCLTRSSPAVLRALVRTLLATHPEERPASASAAVALLEDGGPLSPTG